MLTPDLLTKRSFLIILLLLKNKKVLTTYLNSRSLHNKYEWCKSIALYLALFEKTFLLETILNPARLQLKKFFTLRIQLSYQLCRWLNVIPTLEKKTSLLPVTLISS